MAEDPARFVELFAPVVSVRARRMFGGLGISIGDAMIALVADGTLYFKVDDRTKPSFSAAGGRPFVYEGKGKRIEMSYWTVPDAIHDDEAELARWTMRAREAAERALLRRPAKARPARPR